MSRGKTTTARATVKFALLLLFLGGLGIFAWRYNVEMAVLKEYVEQISPAWRYPAFIALFSLISVAPVPARDVVKLTGAVLFGGFVSGLLVYAGEMGAVALTWVLGRFFGKELINRLMEGRLAAMQETIRGASWWQVAILRVFPGTPYRFCNYAASVTEINAGSYFLGCAVGTLPRTMAFQLLFGVLGEGITEGGLTTFQIFLVSIGFTVVVLTSFALWTRWKNRSSG